MKVRTALIAAVMAVVTVFPFAGPAQATHACGFDPCVGHVEDACYISLVRKYFSEMCS